MNKVIVNAILFALTFFTTLVAGAYLAGGNPLAAPRDLVLGFMFSIPLLSILGVHELGHYTAARRHDIEVTPPYFIPAPSFIGTFGAFIKIRSPVPNRNALMDIGAAGPIAGAIVAVPVLLIGLKLSVVRETAGMGAGIPLGESLLFRAAIYTVIGSVPDGYDVVLHPVAFAGWIGLLVTALNLLPSGQLDASLGGVDHMVDHAARPGDETPETPLRRDSPDSREEADRYRSGFSLPALLHSQSGSHLRGRPSASSSPCVPISAATGWHTFRAPSSLSSPASSVFSSRG
jgi:membrane-associated protease RseP (regulator of RpoE activity)